MSLLGTPKPARLFRLDDQPMWIAVRRVGSPFLQGSLWASLTLVTLAGCREETPRAPALRNGPIYQNESAGLRFLVPERWQQTANSTLPDSPIEKEMLLTRYRIPTSAQGATLEILCMETNANGDPVKYHQRPSYSIDNWKIVEGPEAIATNGASGQRFRLEGQMNERGLGKEVYVFSRGDRQFHFVGLYAPDDPNARQQIQRVVESLVWRE